MSRLKAALSGRYAIIGTYLDRVHDTVVRTLARATNGKP